MVPHCVGLVAVWGGGGSTGTAGSALCFACVYTTVMVHLGRRASRSRLGFCKTIFRQDLC